MKVRQRRERNLENPHNPFHFHNIHQIEHQLIFVLINLWCQVVLNIPRLTNGILHNNRNFWAHGQNHSGSQTCRLCKEVEVPKRKSQFHGLLHVDHHLIFIFLRRVVLADQHIASTKIASYMEFDPLLRAADGEGVAKDLHVTDDALEFAGGHLNGTLVLSIGDSELLAVNVHEFELKVGNAILPGTLEHQRQGVPVVLGLQGDDIVIPCALENLPHVRGIEPQADGSVTPEVVEAAGTQTNGHEGDVGVVHGLDGHLVVGAVDVGLLDEVFQRLNELLEYFSLGETGFKHGCGRCVGVAQKRCCV